MSQTIQTEHLRVKCSKSGQKTPISIANTVLQKCLKIRLGASLSCLQTQFSRKLPIARNLSKLVKKLIEAASTDAVLILFY